MMEYRIYAGTYAGADENGIFRYRMDGNSQILERELALPGISNPSYLALSQNGTMMYAVMEDMEYHGNAGGGVCAIKCRENSLEILNSRGTTGTRPCHVTLDEEAGVIYAANYMSGSLSMFPLMPDGSLGEMSDCRQHKGKGPNTLRQEGPHVHFSGLSPEKDGIWCVDLGLDRILFYGIDVHTMTLSHRPERDIMLPKGTGPRHFVFQPGNAHRMYVVCELSSEVFAVNILKEGCQILQRISSLSSPNDKSSCAAIKCSEDGRFLYVSNRGDDSIAVFRIDPKNGLLHLVQIEKAGGRTPRDILVLKDMLLSANQDSNTITYFYRNEDTGILTRRTGETSCHAPVCLTAVPTA